MSLVIGSIMIFIVFAALFSLMVYQSGIYYATEQSLIALFILLWIMVAVYIVTKGSS